MWGYVGRCRSRLKRESGENPEPARGCERHFSCFKATVRPSANGKARSVSGRKSEDLPTNSPFCLFRGGKRQK